MGRALAAAFAAIVLAACSEQAAPPATQPAPTPSFHQLEGHEIWGACTNGEAPTVVYLHGLGADSTTFHLLAPLVDKAVPEVRECSYDRVNAGRSSLDPAPRPLSAAVTELEAFLADEDVEGPLVLVGSSYGGLLSVAYAGKHPEMVKGIVLADCPLPFEPGLFDQAQKKALTQRLFENPEHVDIWEAYATAGANPLPDVPVVYVDARQDTLVTVQDVPSAQYDAALAAYIESLPQGKLVRSASTHRTVADTDEFLEAVVAQLSG